MNCFYSKFTAAFKWQQTDAGWAKLSLKEINT